MAPPTRRTVVLETVVGIAAYGPGLGAVTVLAGVLSDLPAILAGVVVSGVMYTFAHVAVLQRIPEFFGRRPSRYSVPNGIGLLAASAVSWMRLDPATTFALAIPLLIAGQTASQLWWSQATSPDAAGLAI